MDALIVQWYHISASPLAESVQSNRKRNFEKANIEYRTRNVECRSNVFCLFYKKLTERSDSTLRYSIFDIRYSIFCGSLFNSHVVSYKGKGRVEFQLNSIGRVGQPTVAAELNTFFDPAVRNQQGDAKRGRGGAEYGYFAGCQQVKHR